MISTLDSFRRRKAE